MTQKVRYGKRMATVQPAAGLRGVLCRSIDGDYFFRVTDGKGRFSDYQLRHSDLTVTIAADEEAALYRIGSDGVLDHAPETLGLERVGGRSRKRERERIHTTLLEEAQGGLQDLETGRTISAAELRAKYRARKRR